MTPEQVAVLVRRYQQQLHRTSLAAGAAMVNEWDQLGQWDEADVETFAKAAAPAITAAQSHAAALAAGFVSLAAGVALTGDHTFTAPDWQRPFNAYWASLSNGQPWADAVTVGRNAAEATGFDAVQSAARDTTAEIDKATPQITGWRRVPDPGACAWCEQVAGQEYRTAETASFGHDRCGCSVVPA